MSGTLNLIDRLLTMGRNLQQLSCDHEALDVLGRLANLRELPPDVAEETQFRIAEIHLKRRRHKTARRHLSIALLYRPDSARYHHLMATTLERKADSLERAAEHYRKSLECDPQQPLCLAEFGLLTLRRGLVADGLQRLRQAAEMAPDDPAVLAKVLRGLRRAENFDEALSLLRAARFRNPRDGRFLRLYNDLMFRQLRRQQHNRGRAVVPSADEPTLLPFVRVESAAVAESTIIRIDSPALPRGPHTPHRPLRRSDGKHG